MGRGIWGADLFHLAQQALEMQALGQWADICYVSFAIVDLDDDADIYFYAAGSLMPAG